MSHELRTPLTAIAMSVELMDTGAHGPVSDEQRRDLLRVRRCQSYLVDLIDSVLTFMKLGSGQLRYDIGSVSVDSALATVEEMIRPQTAAKRLAYESPCAGLSQRVRADEEKLKLILVNLVTNAIKFTPSGGTIAVTCGEDDDNVSIQVRDTGCGIPADEVDRVFEPFVQLQRPLAAPNEGSGGGTGLGLAISRDFARGMGGRLFAESQLRQGSVFTLELPRAR
jgi:signal transduction histidine kinase